MAVGVVEHWTTGLPPGQTSAVMAAEMSMDGVRGVVVGLVVVGVNVKSQPDESSRGQQRH